MELLFNLLDQYLALLASTILFSAVVLLVIAVGNVGAPQQSRTARRLEAVAQASQPESREPHQEAGFTVRFLKPAARLLTTPEQLEQSEIRQRLARAGVYRKDAPVIFYGSKIVLAVLLSLGLLVAQLAFGGYAAVEHLPLTGLYTLLAAACGFYFPDGYLLHRRRQRQQAVREGFPDALDMLVVCVEAGLSLDPAIRRVGEEIGYSHAPLGEEFYLLSLELRAGKTRSEALRAFADRTGLEEAKALAGVLIQAEQFGTGIAPALRAHAEDMRTKRIQLAQEKAAKLPVKLIFPVLLFIFPSLLLVVLGPAAIRIYEGLVRTFSG